jgi:circadian clock protein KaiC
MSQTNDHDTATGRLGERLSEGGGPPVTNMNERAAFDRRQGQRLNKVPTGVPGLDQITAGGFPSGRVTAVCGTAGAGKTVFAVQFLAAACRRNEGAVFVTFEEDPKDTEKNMRDFGFAMAEWKEKGLLAVVDGSPRETDVTDVVLAGKFDLSALVARIEHAAKKVNATRVSIDSLAGLFNFFTNEKVVRAELFRLSMRLKALELDVVMTAERDVQYGAVSRSGIEEFVADNVIILRHHRGNGRRRRTVEVMKMRGSRHTDGETTFTLAPGTGIVAMPMGGLILDAASTSDRTTFGTPALDEVTGGGIFRDSVTLLSGPTGSGKTLLTTHFVAKAAERGEKALLLGLEESREQLYRNASSWGIDLDRLEKSGKLRILCRYPESMTLPDQLLSIRSETDAFKPDRMAIDSISALERGSDPSAFREFVITLVNLFKHQRITGLMTTTNASLHGGESVTDQHISTLADAIILLRYIENQGEVLRSLTVLKMRGSDHEKRIRQLLISSDGLKLGQPMTEVSGLITDTYTALNRKLGDVANALRGGAGGPADKTAGTS